MQDNLAEWIALTQTEVTPEECLAMRENTKAFVMSFSLVNGHPLVREHSLVMQQTWSSSSSGTQQTEIDDDVISQNQSVEKYSLIRQPTCSFSSATETEAEAEAEAGGAAGAVVPRKQSKSSLSTSSSPEDRPTRMDSCFFTTTAGTQRTARVEAETTGTQRKRRLISEESDDRPTTIEVADAVADAEAKFQDSELAVFVHPRHNNQQTYSVESITIATVGEHSLCHQWTFILSIDRGLKYAGMTLSLYPTEDDWLWASQMLGCDCDQMKSLF